MIYKKLFLQLILRLGLIVLLSIFMAWILWVSAYPFMAVGVALFIIYTVYQLIRYLNSTNRLLSQFFLAVKNDETALQIQHTGMGSSFDELRDSMQYVNQIIKDLRVKYQQKEIVSDAIIENAAVGILTFNSLGLVECINRKGRELLGVHHLVSIKALLKIDPKLVNLFQDIKAGESRVLNTVVKQKSLHLVVSCTAIRLGNENLKLLSFSDIKNEMDATELESWQRLISVLTHEIMNSIAPLTSLSETLAHTYNQIDAGTVMTEKTLSKTRLGLQVIQEQGEGLTHFVDTYRQLSRIPKPQIKEVSVHHLFEHLKALLVLDEECRISYEFCVEDEALSITADEKLLMQVLINLVQNAQYAITGSGKIQLHASRNAPSCLHITISDNGVGIKPEEIKNIFVPFFTTRENGSGIGLSIARQIMRLHQGRISMESTYGEGSRVELSFPQ